MTDDARYFAESPEPPERPLKVLVVDDHPLNRCVMQAILAQFGCSITHAMCGEEAVELTGLAAFDLIVMDFHMPGISGDEAAGQIRAAGASRRAYIVQWSTDPPPRHPADLYDAALVKPVTCAAVAVTIEAARRWSEDQALGRPAPAARSRRLWF